MGENAICHRIILYYNRAIFFFFIAFIESSFRKLITRMRVLFNSIQYNANKNSIAQRWDVDERGPLSREQTLFSGGGIGGGALFRFLYIIIITRSVISFFFFVFKTARRPHHTTGFLYRFVFSYNRGGLRGKKKKRISRKRKK